MFFSLFVPNVTEITNELLYIRLKCAGNHGINAKSTIMDPKWNLLRNGIITIIASLALAFGLALLSGGAKAASPDNSASPAGSFTTAAFEISEPRSGRTIQ